MKSNRYSEAPHSKTIKTVNFSMAALALAVSYAGTAPVAMAQSESFSLEEVVVTARRREENLQEVPIAITAMGEDFLRTQNITQIEDLGTKVPSLRISAAGGSANEPLVSLRGQRPAESAFNQDQAVSMYFNEVVIGPSQGGNLGMYDLQDVQVLKGPQGTLFGRNSTAGAILMTPKRPGDELGGYAEVEVGSYDLRGFQGAVDVPMTDSLAMRVAAKKTDRDGYQENVANNALKGLDYGDDHSESFRVSLNYDGDRLSNLLVMAHDENDIRSAVPVAGGSIPGVGLGSVLASNASYQRAIARDNPWKIESNVDSKEYVKNIFVSNTTQFEINDDVTLKNVVGYRKVDFETASDIDGIDFAGWGTLQSHVSGVVTDPIPSVLDSEFFSEEIQLLGSAMDDRLDWIVGAYASKMDTFQHQIVQQAPTGAGPYTDDSKNHAVNKAQGLFAETTYRFSDEWSLTTGLRQSWDDREYTVSKRLGIYTIPATMACNVTGVGGVALPDCTRTVDEQFSSPTWRMSANYTPEDGVLYYGSVSTGYRAGGFNLRGNSDATLAPFQEETVTNYELGHKADWDFSWGTVRTNTAAYFQQYEDIHRTVSFFDSKGVLATNTINAAKAEITGLEFDVTVMPSDSLVLNFSYSVIDAQFKEKENVLGGVVVDTSDNDFSYIPEQTLTASATYTLPVDASLGEMSLMASVYWQDEMKTHELYNNFSDLKFTNRATGVTAPWTAAMVEAAQENSIHDAYKVVNVRFDWRQVMGSEFDVALYVDNATDEEYQLGGLNVVDSGGYSGALYGAPRTVGASMRYSF